MAQVFEASRPWPAGRKRCLGHLGGSAPGGSKLISIKTIFFELIDMTVSLRYACMCVKSLEPHPL